MWRVKCLTNKYIYTGNTLPRLTVSMGHSPAGKRSNAVPWEQKEGKREGKGYSVLPPSVLAGSTRLGKPLICCCPLVSLGLCCLSGLASTFSSPFPFPPKAPEAAPKSSCLSRSVHGSLTVPSRLLQLLPCGGTILGLHAPWLGWDVLSGKRLTPFNYTGLNR